MIRVHLVTRTCSPTTAVTQLSSPVRAATTALLRCSRKNAAPTPAAAACASASVTPGTSAVGSAGTHTHMYMPPSVSNLAYKQTGHQK